MQSILVVDDDIAACMVIQRMVQLLGFDCDMVPIVGALLGTLAESGLNLLSSAIQAKGKEVVENVLGVKISDNPSLEEVEKLRQLQYDHEERLLELEFLQDVAYAKYLCVQESFYLFGTLSLFLDT